MAAKEAPEKKEAGRRTKLTPEVQKTICDTIAGGSPFWVACARAGISMGAFEDWRNLGEAANKGPHYYFYEATKWAEADAIARKVAIIEKAAMGDPKNEVSPQWQAAAWALERRYPKDFARRTEIVGEGGGVVKVECGWWERVKGKQDVSDNSGAGDAGGSAGGTDSEAG